MLRTLLVIALVGSSVANDQQMTGMEQTAGNEQISANEQISGAEQIHGEQRTNSHKHKPHQTILIVKPTKTHHSPPTIICGPNQVLSDCVTPCQPTCEFPNQLPCPEFSARSNSPNRHHHHQSIIIIKPHPSKPHPNPPSPCSSGCVCAHGYVRNEFGVCIPKSLCPPLCRPHYHFEKCGPRCQPTCELAEPRSLSVCSHDTGVCVSGCFCDAGYVKDLKNGQCVKPKDCTQVCPENEHYSDYGVPCVPTCQKPVVDIYKCNNYSVELPGCYCNRGFLRDLTTKHCVREHDCPRNPPNRCPANEEFYQCKPCTPTCAEPQRQCVLAQSCYSGCECKKGYIRDSKTNKCVQLCECPQFNPPHKY